MPQLSSKQGASVVKLLIAGMVCFLLLVGYVFFQAYQGRTDLVNSQRAGCERAKLDRAANAEGWRTAQTARLRTLAETMHISFDAVKQVLKQKPSSGDLPDLVAARRYDSIAAGLEDRSRINCTEAFPDAKIFL